MKLISNILRVLLLAGFTSTGSLMAADVQLLARDLESEYPETRAKAAAELGRLGDDAAVPRLARTLGDPEPRVRRAAAMALGSLRQRKATLALVKALADSDMNVRAAAAYALGEIRDPRATEALLKAFVDPEWCVRDQAAWALRELRDPGLAVPLVALLREDRADADAVGWLLKSFDDKDAVEALAPLLRDEAVAARIRALRTLRDLKSEAGKRMLLLALDDRDAAVRLFTVRTLAKEADADATRALKAALPGETDPRVRAALEDFVRESSHEKDLAAWWSFDDRDPKVARDVTGNGNDGELKGAAPERGRIGAGLRCGRGKFASFGKAPNLSMANSPLTVMAWIKTEARTGVVIARGGGFCGFSLYLKDGTARFGIHRNQEAPVEIVSAEFNADGSWAHLAGVIRQDALELFVNGRSVGTTKTGGYIPGNCGQGLEIGFDLQNSPAEITDAFEGVIDEVKIYRAALDPDEIAAQCVFPQP